MSHGINIGRIFGIRITLDWSLIFIFLLVAFNLGAGVFPAWHPGWSALLTWTVAVAAAVLFFASVLVHELSHALVAKVYDVPVRSITLFLFGGIANIEHDPDSPKEEALMAGVGPLTSIGLGVGFIVLMRLLSTVPAGAMDNPLAALEHLGPVATLLAWLGPINILVGVFNLIPAFPLDGGRVFRALLWALTRNVRTATRWASRAGQGFAWFLIIVGVAMAFGVHVPVFGGGLIQGLWFAFIGWFLNTAAVASYRQLIIRDLLQDVPVRRLMRRELPPMIDPESPISTLVDDYLLKTGQALFLVGNPTQGTLGVVRVDDVQQVPREQWPTTNVGRIMRAIADLPQTTPDQDAFQALQALGRLDVDEMLVMDGGQIVGIIRRQDIARWLELESHNGGGRARPGTLAGSHN